MSCFLCGSSQVKKALEKINSKLRPQPSASPDYQEPKNPAEIAKSEHAKVTTGNTKQQIFTFQELANATQDFSPECLIDIGGFGRLYRGNLEEIGQFVAIKQLDKNGSRGHRGFLVELLMLSLLNHPNLIDLIGYCVEGDERFLVCEYMPLGSLDQHLHENKQKPLDWCTRMKIGLGVARGLEYLHEKANPPVIHRNLKPSNILLDDDYNAKLSNFGLSKLGPTGDKTYVSAEVVGTYGYIAPEYERTGLLTVKADVYSFGVVLLELIIGQRAIDVARLTDEQNMASWVHNIMKSPEKIQELADLLLLEGDFPAKGFNFNQALAVAAMCLQEEAASRPRMTDVVAALMYLSTDLIDNNSF